MGLSKWSSRLAVRVYLRGMYSFIRSAKRGRHDHASVHSNRQENAPFYAVVAGARASRNSAGRSPAVKMLPLHNIIARSMMLCNSRTLPGKE